MVRMKDFSIKYKLIFLSLSTSFLALFLGISALIIYNWQEFKQDIIEELRTVSLIIGNNSVAPLLFNDQEAAEEVLSALQVKTHIVSAVLYDNQGKLFARYGKGFCSNKSSSLLMNHGFVYLQQEIIHQGEKVGSLCLKATMKPVYQRLKTYVILGWGVLLISMLMAFLFSSYVQNYISLPILKMAEIAAYITKHKDYHVRVENIPQRDELGVLVHSFNAMLTEIENRDANLEYLVDKRTKELQEAIERLKELDRMKSEFLSNVSHELRTPLTSVRGFAFIIKKQFEKYILPKLVLEEKKVAKAAKKITENLDIIILESQRLTNLINDVLDLAKIESGKMEWQMKEVDLKKVMEQAAKAIEPLAREKGLYVRGETEGKDFTLIGEEERLMQVATNIFGNGVKFTDKGGITYRIKADEKEILCEIEDTGCGIPEDMLESVFEKFKQVGDTLTEKPQGTGLGLPICREIINHHGGKIWVESKLGQGSKFVFVLPKNR